MNDDILSQVKTKESAEVFKDELELLLKSLYLGKNEFASVLKTKARAWFAEYLKKKLAEEDVDIEKILKELLSKLEIIPTVRLIVAYEPSESDIDRYYSFIADACGNHVLLDIGYAPDIIGGAVIIYKGRYRDFSFKSIFENEFNSERENIIGLL